MAGFGRNESVDAGGFRGVIPDNTTIAVLCIEADANLVKMKKGVNAGKTARIYKPVVECLIGKYRGGRVYGDVWCNVEPDPSGGDPLVFGSHMIFCDMCDASEVHEDDGTYPTAANEADAKQISQRFVGKMFLVTVGINDYPKKDGTTGTKNTIKAINSMTTEQKAELVEKAASTTERVARQQAKKAANAGGTGFNDEPEEDDDTPF